MNKGKKGFIVVCLMLLVLTGCNAKENKLKKELKTKLEENKQILLDTIKNQSAEFEKIVLEVSDSEASVESFTILLDQARVNLQAAQAIKDDSNSIINEFTGPKELLDAYTGKNEKILGQKNIVNAIITGQQETITIADKYIAYYNQIIPIYEEVIYNITRFQDVLSRGNLGADGVYYYYAGTSDYANFNPFQDAINNSIHTVNEVRTSFGAIDNNPYVESVTKKRLNPILIQDYIDSIETK